jgi:hypothetical protein
LRSRLPALLTALPLLAFAAGCAPPAEDTAAPPPAAQPRWESCTAAGAEAGTSGDAPRLADTFRPVSAILCQPPIVRLPAGTTAPPSAERRADDIDALVAALRLPSEKPTNGACTAEAVVIPWIALLDDSGRWVHPGTPLDGCRKPRKEVLAALDQLHLTGSEAPPAPTPSAAAGCTSMWADMVWVAGESNNGSGTPDALSTTDDTSVRVCIYAIPAGQRGSGKPGGELESARTLTPSQWALVKRDLSSAAPATPCRTPATRFAVVHSQKFAKIYVESDGCHRALIDSASGPGALRKASPQVSAALFG